MDRGRPGFPPDFACPVVLEIPPPDRRPKDTGLSPAVVWRSSHFSSQRRSRCEKSSSRGRSHNPRYATPARLARTEFRHRPVSLATTPGVVLSPPATEMFQFTGFPPRDVHRGVPVLATGGLPHSDTDGSMRGCRSPSLSLLSSVLHRLVVPRHPPTAHHVLPGHGFLDGRVHRTRRNTKNIVSTKSI